MRNRVFFASLYCTVTMLLLSEARAQIAIPKPGYINTVAGLETGAVGYNGDNILATNANLNGPTGVAVDSAGNIYITDTSNQRNRKVTASTGIISTVAGNGVVGPPCAYDDNNNAATAVQEQFPNGVAVDSAGNVYIADTKNYRITKIAGGIGTQVAGLIAPCIGNGGNVGSMPISGEPGFNGDGIVATLATLNLPYSVAVDSAGNVYIADTSNSRIRKVTASTGIISTVAGAGFGCSGETDSIGDGCLATSAELNGPTGVAVDSAGNLFIADKGNQRVRKVVASTGIISTVAGNSTKGYNGDHILATNAELSGPTGVAVDFAGNIYIADTSNQLVRKVAASTGVITTVAGNSTSGCNCDNTSANFATLNNPTGVAVDSAGNLYIADSGNNRIRIVGDAIVDPGISAISCSPTPIQFSSSLTCTVTVTGVGSAVPTGTISWNVGGTTLGSSNLSGGTTSITETIDNRFGAGVNEIFANYSGDSNNQGAINSTSVSITSVPPGISGFSCSPNPIGYGSSLTCTATVTGVGATVPTGTITWSVDGRTLGSSPLSGGIASITTNVDDRFVDGVNTMVASYSGDTYYVPASGSTTVSASGVPVGVGTPTLPQWAALGMGGLLILISIVRIRQKGLGAIHS